MPTLTHTSNPALSEKALTRAAEEHQSGWAAPTGSQPVPVPPMADERTMTMGGVISAAGVLIVILVGFAWLGWSQVDQTTAVDPVTGETINTTGFPPWTAVVGLAAIGLGIVTAFKPTWARVTGPLYAAGIGVFVGAISAIYNATWPGIVLQAVLCTVGVFVMMLFLYATRIIKVTRRLAMGIVAATGAVALVYLVSLVWYLISGSSPVIWDSGPLGVGFSLIVVAIASFNLLLDFSFIERGVEQGLPAGMEWYAGFSLLVTLVWLYLEMLRLLAKLRS
jgi:uncharacterized YccA/Bax inhibitor family protein